MMDPFEVGKLIELKKQHPCGGRIWEVIRKGADIKIKCLKCSHILMIDRCKLDKMVRKK